MPAAGDPGPAEAALKIPHLDGRQQAPSLGPEQKRSYCGVQGISQSWRGDGGSGSGGGQGVPWDRCGCKADATALDAGRCGDLGGGMPGEGHLPAQSARDISELLQVDVPRPCTGVFRRQLGAGAFCPCTLTLFATQWLIAGRVLRLTSLWVSLFHGRLVIVTCALWPAAFFLASPWIP